VRDILENVSAWYRSGMPFAMATVVETWSSAPRTAGASMAVSKDGDVIGSVSGGCVEGAVFELCQEVLTTGIPIRETYGVSDGDAFSIGLTCGGTLEIFIELITPERFPRLLDVLDAMNRRSAIAVATIIDGPSELAGQRVILTEDLIIEATGREHFDQSVGQLARGMLSQGRNGVIYLGEWGEQRMNDVTIFVESFAPSPEMIVFGAIDFAAAVVRVGKFLGYHVTVCDAREVFATQSRFPEADEIVVEWPHSYLARRKVNERTVLCVLTHDPKFDVPLLQEALHTKAGYIGAMGSRRTHLDRLARLRAAGLDEEALNRLSSPIGLDLGGRTPEETAISIAAEIIASKWGGSGQRLSDLSTPIHR